MAWVIFDKYIENLFDATTKINLDTAGDTIKMALVTVTNVPDASSTGDEFWSDLSATEVSGTGYTAGGAAVGSQVVTLGASAVTFDIANQVFSQNAAGFTNARYAIIYKDTGVAATSPLICYADLSSDRSVVSGDLTIEIDAAGVFTAA